MRQMAQIKRMTLESDFFSSPCFELEVDGKRLRYVESNRLAHKRVESLFTKEPTTIPWLESMSSSDVLIDIGANVGMYSIYAACLTGCRVYSFEPESLNYAELNKNIFANGLHERVSAYCIALSDEDKIGHLLLGAFGYAYSHHDFNENTWKEDKHFGDKVTRKEQRLRQGCTSATLDHLIESGVIPPPQHIKIDVDGLEDRVVRGAERSLRHPELKTVLIEIDHRIPSCRAIVEYMTGNGWRYSVDQLRTNRKVIFTPEQIAQFQRDGLNGFNYVFFRDDAYEDLFRNFLSTYTPPMRKS